MAKAASSGLSVMRHDLDAVTSTSVDVHEAQWRAGVNRQAQPEAVSHQLAASQHQLTKRPGHVALPLAIARARARPSLGSGDPAMREHNWQLPSPALADAVPPCPPPSLPPPVAAPAAGPSALPSVASVSAAMAAGAMVAAPNEAASMAAAAAAAAAARASAVGAALAAAAMSLPPPPMPPMPQAPMARVLQPAARPLPPMPPLPPKPPPKPPLALFHDEQRKAHERGDLRADVLALNVVLRAHGPPAQAFGAPSVAIGHTVSSRAELCVLGIHRHFLSEASFTPQGMESLVLVAQENEAVDAHSDLGERIYFCASERRRDALAALAVNAERQRPVRLLRAEMTGGANQHNPSAATRQQQGRALRFRYDGLYLVLRHTPSLEPSSTAVDRVPEGSFLLLRQAGQPPLPLTSAGASRKRGLDETSEGGAALSLVGSLLCSAPSATLPVAAEQVCYPPPRTILNPP